MSGKGKSNEKKAAILLLVFCLLYLFSAWHLKMGSMKDPGPGVFPLLVGGLLAICAAIYLVQVFGSRGLGKKPEEEKNRDHSEQRSLWVLVVVVTCTLVYPFFLVKLKFLAATQMAAFGMLWAYKPDRPLPMFLLGAAMTILLFVIFYRFLGVGLPSGYLEEMIYRLVR